MHRGAALAAMSYLSCKHIGWFSFFFLFFIYFFFLNLVYFPPAIIIPEKARKDMYCIVAQLSFQQTKMRINIFVFLKLYLVEA